MLSSSPPRWSTGSPGQRRSSAQRQLGVHARRDREHDEKPPERRCHRVSAQWLVLFVARRPGNSGMNDYPLSATAGARQRLSERHGSRPGNYEEHGRGQPRTYLADIDHVEVTMMGSHNRCDPESAHGARPTGAGRTRSVPPIDSTPCALVLGRAHTYHYATVAPRTVSSAMVQAPHALDQASLGSLFSLASSPWRHRLGAGEQPRRRRGGFLLPDLAAPRPPCAARGLVLHAARSLVKQLPQHFPLPQDAPSARACS